MNFQTSFKIDTSLIHDCLIAGVATVCLGLANGNRHLPGAGAY